MRKERRRWKKRRRKEKGERRGVKGRGGVEWGQGRNESLRTTQESVLANRQVIDFLGKSS